MSGKNRHKLFFVISSKKLGRFWWNLVHNFLNKFGTKNVNVFHLNWIVSLHYLVKLIYRVKFNCRKVDKSLFHTGCVKNWPNCRIYSTDQQKYFTEYNQIHDHYNTKSNIEWKSTIIIHSLLNNWQTQLLTNIRVSKVDNRRHIKDNASEALAPMYVAQQTSRKARSVG